MACAHPGPPARQHAEPEPEQHSADEHDEGHGTIPQGVSGRGIGTSPPPRGHHPGEARERDEAEGPLHHVDDEPPDRPARAQRRAEHRLVEGVGELRSLKLPSLGLPRPSWRPRGHCCRDRRLPRPPAASAPAGPPRPRARSRGSRGRRPRPSQPWERDGGPAEHRAHVGALDLDGDRRTTPVRSSRSRRSGSAAKPLGPAPEEPPRVGEGLAAVVAPTASRTMGTPADRARDVSSELRSSWLTSGSVSATPRRRTEAAPEGRRAAADVKPHVLQRHWQAADAACRCPRR